MAKEREELKADLQRRQRQRHSLLPLGLEDMAISMTVRRICGFLL